MRTTKPEEGREGRTFVHTDLCVAFFPALFVHDVMIFMVVKPSMKKARKCRNIEDPNFDIALFLSL